MDKCNHKDCEENWASDDQWAIDKNGYCIRCNYPNVGNFEKFKVFVKKLWIFKQRSKEEK